MSEVLLHVSRANCIENIHRGDIAVVDYHKKLLAYWGNPYKKTYMRSSAKPIQALSVVESGAYDAFNFTKQEVALMCASHYAETFHVEAAESALSKIGLDENALLLGKTYSLNETITRTLCRTGQEERRIFNNCSGKHAGMLAIARQNGFDIATYDQLENPVQQMMLQTVSDVSEVDSKDIGIGIDGCGVPVFELPLFNMALSFAKLAHSEVFEPKRKNAVDTIVSAMVSHPEMVAGTNGFCTELMKQTSGKIIAKLGADAVYCVGIVDKGIGLAVKIEDGNVKVLSSVVMEVLHQLDVLTDAEKKALSRFHIQENINSKNFKVGEIRPVFSLNQASAEDR